MSSIENKILNVIRTVVSENELIPLHEPCFIGNEWEYIKDCIDSTFVSSVGKYVDLFEEKLAEFIGVKRAVAVINGTSALHIALKIVGVKNRDEVIIPSLTFVATANAVAYCNAVPHFADISENTLGIDPHKLEEYLQKIAHVKDGKCINKLTGRRIKAIIPMHTLGHPVDLDPLLVVCEKYQLEVVEDAAESLGSYYKGKHTGSFGKISAISFNGNKIITTGGGGAILTNEDHLADMAKHLTTTAKVTHPWEYEHDEIGFNYRLPNINAAMGCAQLEQLPIFLKNKRKLTQMYKEMFDSINDVEIFLEPIYAKSNYWLQALMLSENQVNKRDIILEHLNSSGVISRPLWKPLHTLRIFNECPKMDLSVTENMASRVINIPSNPRNF